MEEDNLIASRQENLEIDPMIFSKSALNVLHFSQSFLAMEAPF